MNLKKSAMLFCAAAMIIALGAGRAAAEEKKFEVEGGTTIKRTLELNNGKTVTLRLSGGGEEMTGVVGKVGDFVVHVKALQRREFYDAVIQIDRIDAVILRAADKK